MRGTNMETGFKSLQKINTTQIFFRHNINMSDFQTLLLSGELKNGRVLSRSGKNTGTFFLKKPG